MVHPVPTFALIGAGNRGADVYANYLHRHPGRGRVVAAADPDPLRLERVGDAHGLPAGARFRDADALLRLPRLADVLIVATPDALHVEPAAVGLERGYHLLLEKPIAPDAAGVARLAAAARRSGGSVTVAHVLRYTPFFGTVKRLLEEGRIGRLIDVAQVEHVGFWHFAHSYVRGNWRREETASPMILAKACHDLDVLRWLVGDACTAVASFGELSHFRPEEAPAGAADRCLDCEVESTCPYSARRIYLERFGDTDGWPISVVTRDTSVSGRIEALRSGPYGRCVYRCDNDVVDHQVVALTFAGGVSASLGVNAFSEANTRTIALSGTHGEIRGRLEEGRIEVRDFVSGELEVVEVGDEGGTHAGGDDGLMRDLTERLARAALGGGAVAPPTSLEVSLESHAMAFAAERARRDGRVVRVDEVLSRFA